MYRIKEKQRRKVREWRKNNKDKCLEYQKTWINKIGMDEYRRLKSKYIKKYRAQPWIKTYQNICQRLRRSQDLESWGNKYRCYVGILNFLTPADLKKLWRRDGAAKMIKPSIDRKESTGHYTVDNCQYIEMAANRAKVKSPGPQKNKLKKI